MHSQAFTFFQRHHDASIELLELFDDLERNLPEDINSEERQQILKAKKALYEGIVHRDNQENLFTNALIGLLVLTHMIHASRHKGKSETE